MSARIIRGFGQEVNTVKIEMCELSKEFENGTPALSDINLVIENGIFGLIGPNASGKTTLLRILATLVKPSTGKVTFDGRDLNHNRARIRSMTGYLPQRFSRFRKLKTREFLDYSATLAGIFDKKIRQNEVDNLLESLGLSKVGDVEANDLSVVMKRLLEIAQAVIGNPSILLVDEPTLGLSPEERIRFRNMLNERSKKIDVIIMTSHILADISSTCQQLAVLNKGEVVYQGVPADIPGEEHRYGWFIDGLKPGGENTKKPGE
jgi:ABC-2 type transport system ATP-binding protein